MSGGQQPADGLEWGVGGDQFGEQRRLAGNQAVERGARNAGPIGELVHGQPADSVGPNHLHGGAQDPIPGAWFRSDLQCLEQGIA